jgi:osmoprotectant transport system substrate-binding protein
VRRTLVTLALASLIGAAACGQNGNTGANDQDAVDGPTITVGSADFTESIVLAEILSQGLEAKGYTTNTKLRIGAREVYFPALEKGEIDVAPEYTGSLLSFLTKQKKTASPNSDTTYADVTEALEGKGVTLSTMSEAQDKDGIVVNKETAEEYDATTISDIAPHAAELVMGGPPECQTRTACLKGLEDVYGMRFKEFKSLDAGGPQTITALKTNAIQVANLFTTDSRFAANGFVLLEDDKAKLAGAENVVAAINTETLDAYGENLTTTLDEIVTKLTTDGLLELNDKVDNDKADPEDVAAEWLEANDLATS